MRIIYSMVAISLVMIGLLGCTANNPFGFASHYANRSLVPGNQPKSISLTKPSIESPAHDNDQSHVSIQQIAQVSHAESAPTTKHTTLVTLGPDDKFYDLIHDAPGVVMVDFYADWCGPCRTQGKILRDVADTAAQHHASIIKVNIDQHRQLANKFNVSSLPTLVLVKDGKVIERRVGLTNRHVITKLLSK